MPGTKADAQWMQRAIRVANRHKGLTGENPSVGCVIVKNDRLISSACTAIDGRPHAEKQAIASAVEDVRGATLYVTLEPCVHEGLSGACTKTIIDSGLSRVVIGSQDPNPVVSGKSAAVLRAAGIKVTGGVLSGETDRMIADFATVMTQQRPLVTVKMATSADGYTARADQNDKWITGPQARGFGHLMRARHAAILVGSQTVMDDDPMLDVRIPGLELHSPTVVVADRRLRIPTNAKLLHGEPKRRVIICTCSDDAKKIKRLQALGCDVIVGPDGFGPDFIVEVLGKKGINSVLVEGGVTLVRAFFKAGLVDRLAHFKADFTLGDAGRAPFALKELAALDKRASLSPLDKRVLDRDHLTMMAITRKQD